jgi:hypothetical protein
MIYKSKASLCFILYCFLVCGLLLVSCKDKKVSTLSNSQTSDLKKIGATYNDSIPSNVVVYPKEAIFPKGLSKEQINAYINHQKINIVDGWNVLITALKNDPKAIIEKVSIVADGLEANADTDRGFIRLLLKTEEYSIEFGGKVGMTIQEVKTKYPGGYSSKGDLEYPDGTYFYLVVDENDPAITRGFVFYLDENKNVRSIVMGYVIFAE